MFVTFINYRETNTKTIPLDERDLVETLVAYGVVPVKADTNGTKLRFHFEEESSREAINKIQQCLAGMPVDVKLDLMKMVGARTMWKNALSSMRSVVIPQ